MKLYVCVDDTDDLTKSTSTGKIADMIAQEIIKLGGTMERGITRHQLLIHDDIDYTSHNSSMCAVINIEGVEIPEMHEIAVKVLEENMAESSDPGLCFCRLDQLDNPEMLIAYGKRAQNEVIKKHEAYELAEQLGILLTEHGGTGCGVIGALAGVGLRLSGCDGVFRGNKSLKFEDETHTIAEWKQLTGIELFVDFEDGHILSDDIEVEVGNQLKTTLVDDQITLVCAKKGGSYKACKKKDLYHGDKRVTEWTTSCKYFEQDNDIEECYDDTDNACYNCLYRRWTADGYRCVK